jgi:hypothetical protein
MEHAGSHLKGRLSCSHLESVDCASRPLRLALLTWSDSFGQTVTLWHTKQRQRQAWTDVVHGPRESSSVKQPEAPTNALNQSSNHPHSFTHLDHRLSQVFAKINAFKASIRRQKHASFHSASAFSPHYFRLLSLSLFLSLDLPNSNANEIIDSTSGSLNAPFVSLSSLRSQSPPSLSLRHLFTV